jgi:hypothetical protein
MSHPLARRAELFSHAIFLSHAREVAALIEKAATAAK